MSEAAFERAHEAWESSQLNRHLAEEEAWDAAYDKAEGVVWGLTFNELYEMSPPSEVRAFVETGAPFARDVWQRASTELGLMGVHLPEEFGGAGFGARELGIVCEEMGRTLYTGPYFGSSVMASYAVLFFGSEDAKARHLPAFASGETIGLLALDSLDKETRIGALLKSDEMHRLRGRVPVLVGGADADVVFALADGPGGIGLYRLLTKPSVLAMASRSGLDATRRLSTLELSNVPAEQYPNDKTFRPSLRCACSRADRRCASPF